MLFFQEVRELTPTQASLMLIPMAVISGGLAPVVGKLVDRVNPRWIAGAGFVFLAVALFWFGSILSPDVPIWVLLFPAALLGLANAGIWAPLSSTATRNLPMALAGAGSGVYNTTRQIGAVLGSAAIAALMTSRLTDELGAEAASGGAQFGSGPMPDFVAEGFSAAMGQSMFLPAAVALVGLVASIFFAKPGLPPWARKPAEEPAETVESSAR